MQRTIFPSPSKSVVADKFVMHSIQKIWFTGVKFTESKIHQFYYISSSSNPRDGRAWWATVYGVAQSRTRLKRLSSSSSTEEIGIILMNNYSISYSFLFLSIWSNRGAILTKRFLILIMWQCKVFLIKFELFFLSPKILLVTCLKAESLFDFSIKVLLVNEN